MPNVTKVWSNGKTRRAEYFGQSLASNDLWSSAHPSEDGVFVRGQGFDPCIKWLTPEKNPMNSKNGGINYIWWICTGMLYLRVGVDYVFVPRTEMPQIIILRCWLLMCFTAKVSEEVHWKCPPTNTILPLSSPYNYPEQSERKKAILGPLSVRNVA